MAKIEMFKSYVPIYSFTGQGITPEYAGWKEEDIEEYLKDHPMPVDENYTKEELIEDLIESGGTLTFSNDLKEETIQFLLVLMNWLEEKNSGFIRDKKG